MTKTKDLMVFCRVDDEQFTKIERAAKAAGYDKTSHWVRAVLMNAATDVLAKSKKGKRS